MKLSKTKRDHSTGFVMTPMIDIVFLLIIFFLTVSQINRVAEHPLSLARVDGVAEKSFPATVTINMDSDGKIILSGEQYTLDRTARALERLLGSKANDPTQVRIELRCDRRCPAEHVNGLIRQLSDLGFSQVYAAVAGE